MSESKPSLPQVEASPASAENSASESSPRRIFAAVGIAAVVIAFVALTGIIYYKWWKTPPVPTAMVVIEGSEEFSGADVMVEGGPNAEILYRDKLTSDGGYMTVFHVPPGDYTLHVSYDGRETLRKIRLGSWQVARMPLAKPRREGK